MEKAEIEKPASTEGGSQLNRNRSFKSKQLVRSQAIRESTSPPRTVSPSVRSDDSNQTRVNVNARVSVNQAADSSQDGEVFYNDTHNGKQRVEIQITSGACDADGACVSRRGRRWCDSPRDLLSNNPRVACVCGACGACPHCRGRRRRHKCPAKQDSGIVCSDDCPDCSDTEINGNANDIKKSASGNLEGEEYCRCDRKEKPKNISLSRTDSDDKSEPIGPELVSFIKKTLNKNARDRATLLRVEKELHSFVNDPGRCIVKFPVMTSYDRMLVHRCASLFQLAHRLDQSSKTCVLVSKSGTSGGRIPCTMFKTWCVANLPPSPIRHQQDPTLAKSILKRDTHSLDEPSLGANPMSRSKSLEQREKDYLKVRRRIFSSDNCTQDESQWPWVNAGAPVKLLTPEPGRNKLLKVQSLESPGVPPPAGLSWRNAAGAVSKSHSFGGYGDQTQPRALSRQGDLASSSWRLSPSSSGYKTLSLRSTDSVTPSPTGGGTPEPTTMAPPTSSGAPSAGGALVWAVTDFAAVPRGALVIHPQTGCPITNPDGSVYHFDPANPPILYDPSVYMESELDKIDPNNEKRRGRLEKQHSFMDNDTECQSTEDCRNKCCCECRKQDQIVHEDKTEKENPQPTSPDKSYEPQNQSYRNHTEATNQKPEPANHKPELTNHKPESTNHKQEPANHKQEPANHKQDPANHKPELTNHKPETPLSEPANQRYENHSQSYRGYDPANHKEAVKMMSQDMVHYNYPHVYNTEEHQVTSPSQMNPYLHQDMSNMSNMTGAIPQAKVTPIQVPDPNIRPLSLTNMMYPIQQGYPTYIQNQRMDQLQQQMYQPMLQQPMEEQKQISTTPPHENTFRIDPSYPYAPVDYATACCVDTTQLQHPPQQRSYSVGYNQVEVATVPTMLPPAYPVPNILMPPPVSQYPVQYQEPFQWAQMQNAASPKLYEMCPVVYPHQYTHYNIMYPQMVPQPYPICQPVYPLMENKPDLNRRRSTPTPTSRDTPRSHYDKKIDEKDNNRQNSTEIAVKIQQIKEHMANLNTGGPRDNQWWRNSGNGILGSCPPQYQQYNHGRPTDETQLSTAARAIINSLRNMQAKNTYHQEKRTFTNQTYNRFERDRNDYNNRRRFDRDQEKPQDRTQGNRPDRQEYNGKSDGERKFEPRQRMNPVTLPYRPYLFRQMSPNTWCRRSPAPVHPALNQPRRPHPDNRPRR